jgi:hypothetical protein
MASADQVRTAALALLPTLDFNTATQNAITRQLEAQLHCDLAIHSALLTVRALLTPTPPPLPSASAGYTPCGCVGPRCARTARFQTPRQDSVASRRANAIRRER